MKQRNGKDCLVTVLSEGLNIDYDTIPKFYENDDTWQKEYDKWLKGQGLFRVIIDMIFSEELKFPYCSQLPVLLIGILHQEPKKYEHAVILEIQETDVSMYDPKSNSDYDVTDLGWLFARIMLESHENA